MNNKLDFSDASKLQTRDGREVRIYATDHWGRNCIVGAIRNANGWYAAQWDVEGRFIGAVSANENDLIPKPQRVTGWVNVYEFDIGTRLGQVVFNSKEDALGSSGTQKIGQIYIDAEVQT